VRELGKILRLSKTFRRFLDANNPDAYSEKLPKASSS
jgi:hypothetical protein